jgi:hypothetical protein
MDREAFAKEWRDIERSLIEQLSIIRLETSFERKQRPRSVFASNTDSATMRIEQLVGRASGAVRALVGTDTGPVTA